jgi:hypothetical protein
MTAAAALRAQLVQAATTIGAGLGTYDLDHVVAAADTVLDFLQLLQAGEAYGTPGDHTADHNLGFWVSGATTLLALAVRTADGPAVDEDEDLPSEVVALTAGAHALLTLAISRMARHN